MFTDLKQHLQFLNNCVQEPIELANLKLTKHFAFAEVIVSCQHHVEYSFEYEPSEYKFRYLDFNL